MNCYIYLQNNKTARIDWADYQLTNQHKWHYHSGYVIARQQLNGKRTHILLHRLIMNTPHGMVVDHIDGNRLDNRRKNLRNCKVIDNNRNVSITINNKTGYKGVSIRNDLVKPYAAFIKHNYKTIYLGSFTTPEEAARAYNNAAVKLYGVFAKLNSVAE